MKKAVKGTIRLIIVIVAVTALVVGIKILINGMYLFGIPDLKDVQTVSISYPSVTDEVKEVSSQEDVELSLKLTGFLKYDLFEKADSNEKPLIMSSKTRKYSST